MMNLTTVSRIRQNQHTSLRAVMVKDIPSETISQFIAALQTNTSIKHVELLFSGSFTEQATRQNLWKSLLPALLGLPQLQSLRLKGCTTATDYREGCAIPMSAFTAPRSRNLRLFSLAHLVLSNEGPKDLQNFSQHWKAQKALQDFRLISIGLQEGDDSSLMSTTDALLNPLLDVLAKLPCLKNLEISGTFTPLGVIEEDQVPHSLFQSQSLKRLSISDVIFTPEALSSIFGSLSKNQQLRELAISGDLTSAVAPKLTQLLKGNKTLEALALRLDNLQDEDCNLEVARAIGGSKLQVVSLCSFFGGSLSEASRTAFAKMLETNCDLEYLYVPCPVSDIKFWEKVRLYLGLNCSGRKRLLKTVRDDAEQEEKKQDDVALPPLKHRKFAPSKESAFQSSSTSIVNLMKAAMPQRKDLAPPSLPTSPCSSSASSKESSRSSSPSHWGKRHHHQQKVQEARLLAKKRKLPAVPTQGLSSLFIQ